MNIILSGEVNSFNSWIDKKDVVQILHKMS